MSKAIAFLAGMGAGYMKQGEKDDEKKRLDARDKRDQELHDANMSDRARAQADKDELRAAGSPVAVSEEQLAGPVDPANPDPAAAAPLPTVAKAGAKMFASRGAAETAAADMNTPGGTRQRIMSTLTAQGNPVAADQVRTSGIQADASQMALDAGKRAEANALFDQGLREAISRGPEALATFMSESHADGKGGAVKFRAQTNPDGTWQMMRLGENGAETPFGKPYKNDEAGMATASLLLSKTTTDAAKVAHMLQVGEAKRKADHDAATLKIAQQQANTQEQYRKDQAANMREQRALEEKRITALAAKATAPGGPIVLGLKDMRDFESDLTGLLKDQYPVKEGADEKERAAINGQKTAKTALGNTLFQNNAQLGIPMTAATVLQAMELASDRKNIRVVQVGGVPHEGVVVNGQVVITSSALQKKAPAGPVAAPGATPQPGQAVIDPAIRSAPAGGFVRPPAAAQAAQGVAAPAQVAPDKAAAMAPLNAQVEQASAQLAAAAQSGDQAAIAKYSQLVQQARAARRQAAMQQFGQQQGEEYLSTLPM